MEPDKHQLDGINWKGKPFGSQNLYRVAKSAGKGIYIGVKGGLDKLRSMTPGMIKDRQGWEISTDRKNPQWFTGDEFCEVLESKGITYD